jgi:hypothetical protein
MVCILSRSPKNCNKEFVKKIDFDTRMSPGLVLYQSSFSRPFKHMRIGIPNVEQLSSAPCCWPR